MPTTDTVVAAVRKRPRHLMDPDNPRPPATRGRGMSLSRVQMWVISVLAVTTILHFAAGLVAAAVYVEEERLGARVGLLVIAGVIGVISVLTGAALHRKPLLSWWLPLGVTPALAGAYLIFWA
jgi:type III secretory pathway component EscS